MAYGRVLVKHTMILTLFVDWLLELTERLISVPVGYYTYIELATKDNRTLV
jgi:hypothetical protein